MKYNHSFFDYDKTSYQLNSNVSPTKYNTYQSYQDVTDRYQNLSKLNHCKSSKIKNQDYLQLRQTYNAPSNQFFKNNSQTNKDAKQNKFLRNTLDGSYVGSSKNKQQLTGSYVGEWGYKNHTDRTSFKSNYNLEQIHPPNKDNLNKQSKYQTLMEKINKYQQIDQKLQKSAKIIDQIKKLKDDRKNRIESKKLEQLKIQFKKNQESVDLEKKNFSKKNYVQYYTPKFDKAGYQDRFKQKQNFTKAPQKSTTPSKQIRDKSPIRQQQFIQLKSPQRKKGIINTLQKEKSLINEFAIGKTLGQGKFGNVYIATHISTNSIYALKKVPKEMIKSHMMVDQFLLEIKLQSFMKHQNILTINGFCDDKEYIYLILEYMEQGTLFKLLKAKKVLCEFEAATYLKQIARAVKYIHENGIAHRDIKPQNIVMSNGVCKLCDFGWATVCNERRKTYCGTFDYAAPQILEGIQYDMSVDLWCLGVLAYQLMVGKAPFYHISRKQTMKKIINVDSTTIKYPETLSKDAISFIENLIRKNPDERMRSDSLLNHPFLAKVGTQFH